MKKLILFLFFASLLQGQTITFKGCIPLFDDQNFVFNKTGTDGTGRNIYITTPIDGQNCSGLGSCEFKILWNNSLNRWEFLADEGNGTFTTPYLIYTNTSASIPNPPAINLGVWVENSSITSGACGGNLTTSNATLTGAVQTSVLNTDNVSNVEFYAYPNPVKDYLLFKGNLKITNVELISFEGQKLQDLKLINGRIDLSQLKKGFYLLKVQTDKGEKTIKIIKD